MRINLSDAQKMFKSQTSRDKVFEYHSTYNIVKNTYPEYSEDIIDEICDIIYWFGYLRCQYGLDETLRKKIVGTGMWKHDFELRWDSYNKKKIQDLLLEQEKLTKQINDIENIKLSLENKLKELGYEKIYE